MKSKEIGMFKVLFPASEHFCQSMISDSSRLVERSGGNERNKEVPEVGWGHSMQIFFFLFLNRVFLKISCVKIKTRLSLKLIPRLTFNSSSTI